jgi:hypothetical protein
VTAKNIPTVIPTDIPTDISPIAPGRREVNFLKSWRCLLNARLILVLMVGLRRVATAVEPRRATGVRFRLVAAGDPQ